MSWPFDCSIKSSLPRRDLGRHRRGLLGSETLLLAPLGLQACRFGRRRLGLDSLRLKACRFLTRFRSFALLQALIAPRMHAGRWFLRGRCTAGGTRC